MKKKLGLLLLLMSAVLMTACGGPSKAKIEEVQGVYAQLVSRHNETVEAYADTEDGSFSTELDEMAERLKAIGKQDAKNMSAEELDAVMTELENYLVRYDEIMASIEELKTEKPAENMIAVPVTFKNNTGVELFELYLYKASDENKGDNLVEDIGFLDGYQTRNIVNLYMAEDERLWKLEAIDEEGNVIESAEIDFTGFGEAGVTIHMEYSFDSMEGWIELE